MGNVIRALKSFNSTKRTFFIISILSSCLPLYFMYYHFIPIQCLGLFVGCLTLFLIFIYFNKYALNPEKWLMGELTQIILLFVMVFHLPCHFVGSSRAAVTQEPRDTDLMKWDNYLLGWLFNNGQISISIDNSDIVGPHTKLGKFINNSLQIFYFTYYLIPYVTMDIIYLINVGKELIFRCMNKGQISKTYKKRWNNIYFLFGVYSLTCCFVFFVNTLVPASSPRQFLKKKFTHKLSLIGVADYLNKKSKDDKSANSFPSGHVAEILCISFAYLGMGEIGEGLLILFFSVLILLATLFLRYHYFVDLIAAVVVAFLGFSINYFCGYKYTKNNFENENEEFNAGQVIVINSSTEFKENSENKMEKHDELVEENV